MINKSFTQSIIVEEKQTAAYLGSGTLPVFATPAMIALMENTAMKVLDLPVENTSVGIAIETNHLKACQIGDTIHCKATIKAIDGRKYKFHIIATDENGELIGEGTHERVIVDAEKFMSKLKRNYSQF
ncbi:MAG: thioesterase family protein [Paludibacter sp.]